MQNIENIFRSLSHGCHKILLYMADKYKGASPSQIASGLKINKRKVEYCLNNLLSGGLVVKISRGIYKISRKGLLFINMLSDILDNEQVLIWTDSTLIPLTPDSLKDILGDLVPSTQLNTYLLKLKKNLSSYGVVSIEHLLINLCYILSEEGYGTLCSTISKKMIFSKDFHSLSKSQYRKFLESSMIGYLTPVLKDNVVEIDSHIHLNNYPLIFLSKNNYLRLSIHDFLSELIKSVSEIVINTSDPGYLNNLFNEKCLLCNKHLTLNIYRDEFTHENNDYYREIANNIPLSLIIHSNVNGLLKDPLTLNMIYNNIKRGIDLLIVNNRYFSNMIISKDGFSISSSNNAGLVKMIVKMDIESMMKRNYQSIFLEGVISTILKYDELKMRLINVSLNNNLDQLIYILLKDLKDKWKEDKKYIISFLNEVHEKFKDQQSVDKVMIGLDESIPDEDANILFSSRIPPLSNIIVDVNDLRYTLMKFYKSKYPIIRLFSRS